MELTLAEIRRINTLINGKVKTDRGKSRRRRFRNLHQRTGLQNPRSRKNRVSLLSGIRKNRRWQRKGLDRPSDPMQPEEVHPQRAHRIGLPSGRELERPIRKVQELLRQLARDRIGRHKAVITKEARSTTFKGHLEVLPPNH